MKSAFEKWWNKKGVISGSYETVSEKAWLAALQWALRQAECLSSCSNKKKWIPAYKIKAEIKKLKSETNWQVKE